MFYSQYIRTNSDLGFHIEIEELKDLVAHWLNARDRVTTWKDNRPNAQWVGGFLRRHSLLLTVRKSTIKTRGEFCLTEERLRTFMDRLKVSLEGVDPDCILNMDETSLHWERLLF